MSKRHRPFSRIFAPCVLLLVFAIPATAHPVTFGATGDGPRSDEDWAILSRYIEEENAAGACEFLIHVGDIWHGTETLPESHYARVADLLKSSSVPWFIVPGDNEWNDLDDPDAGWAHWTKYFTRFERNFPGAPEARHQERRMENMAWLNDGVLMIGLNIVGGRIHDEEEWRTRHADDLAWVEENIASFGKDAHAMVVFAQAAPREKQKDFFDPFVDLVRDFRKPALYIHGDGHKWQVEPHWRAPNLTRAQVDQVSTAPIVHITVTDDSNAPFAYDRRIPKPIEESRP